MPRKLIILTTLLGLLIGTIGLPTNIHACNMAKEEKAAKSCGMCDPSHEQESSEGNGCCHNRIELQHTDQASLSKVNVEIAPPTLGQLLVWTLFLSEPLLNGEKTISAQAHPPPLEKQRPPIYLVNSSFLI
ncbi:MAG: hypothetical protein KDD67_05595 [Ignavibacteriae bacterium]|nr:hypothetical protein [Ignavibacteriota bacterium]MCB9214250.1 hypothetical protein [Ignavibacteria bacterium]